MFGSLPLSLLFQSTGFRVSIPHRLDRKFEVRESEPLGMRKVKRFVKNGLQETPTTTQTHSSGSSTRVRSESTHIMVQ